MKAQCNIQWLHHTEGDAETTFTDIETDNNNNIIMAGEVDYGTTGFNYGTVHLVNPAVPNPWAASQQAGVLLKTDANGNELWGRSFTSCNNYASVNSVACDPDGNIYVLAAGDGCIRMTGFGALTDSMSEANYICIVKLNPDGEHVWHSTIYTSSTIPSALNIIDLNYLGNRLLFSGCFRETVYIGNDVYTSGGSPGGYGCDIFLVKMDTSGNFLDSRSFQSTGNELFSFSAITANGDLIVTSSSNGADFSIDGHSLNNSGGGYYDMFCSFDTLDFVANWVKYTYSNPTYASFNKAVCKNNDIYILGAFNNGYLLPPFTLNAAGGGGSYLAKLDLSGNVDWINTASGFGMNYYADVAIASDYIYTTGAIRDSFYFNNIYIGNEDFTGVSLSKFDLSGNHISTLYASDFTNSVCQGDKVVIDNNNDLLVNGRFKKEMMFSDYDIQYQDSSSIPGYGWNAFIAKMCPDYSADYMGIGIKEFQPEQILSLFPNPAHDKIKIDIPGPYEFKEIEITNLSGTKFSVEINQEINISDLKNGFYIVKVICGNGQVIVGKFVKTGI